MASPPTARLSNAPSPDPRDYDAGTKTAARTALRVSLQTTRAANDHDVGTNM